jgi:uncharacterized protein
MAPPHAGACLPLLLFGSYQCCRCRPKQFNNRRREPASTMRRRVRNFIPWTLSVFGAIILAGWIAIRVLHPGPVGKLVLASGGGEGAYNVMGETYRKELARYGVELELRPDLEGIQTMTSLINNDGIVQAGFIKGGVAGSLQGRLASDAEHRWHDRQVDLLRSVGRLFYEPVWVFYRWPQLVKSLREFKGARIYVGTANSGTRLVVTRLLKANGIDDKNATLISEDLPADAAPLLSGKVDVAFLMLPPESAKVQALLRVAGIYLMNFAPEADAYTNRFPSLTKVVLRQGGVEFDPEIPSADITLLATSAALAVRKDLHSALTSILTSAVMHNPKPGFDRDGEPILFYTAGQFPNGDDPEYEVASDARQLYKAGEMPFLLRSVAPMNARFGIPFWVSAFLHEHGTQSILLLIPLLSILVPLSRMLPTLYRWSVRRRLLYWYRQLKSLENSLGATPTQEYLEQKEAELERIDFAVSRIRVPLNFSDQLYDLRGHIDLVRQRLMPRAVRVPSAAAE